VSPLGRLRLHTVLTLAIGLLLLDVARLWGGRVDLTQDHRHTLAPELLALADRVDDSVVAHVAFPPDLPAPYDRHRAAALAVLDALRHRAPEHWRIVPFDPSADAAAAERARALGLAPVTYAHRAWDRTEARTVTMGVAFARGSRTVATPPLVRLERMEIDLASSLHDALQDEADRPKLGWVVGHGEPDLRAFGDDNPLGRLRVSLSRIGELSHVDPAQDALSRGLDVLVVVGPQEPMGDLARFRIDQFLMEGGAVAWFLTEAQPDFQAGRPRVVRHGLHEQLGAYGARPRSALVLDRQHNEATVVPVTRPGGERVLARMNYPLVPTSTAFDRLFSPVRELEMAVLPFSSPIEITGVGAARAEVWLRTMASAATITGLHTLEPRALKGPLPDEVVGPVPAIVALQGVFRSPFATPVAGSGLAQDELRTESAATRMVVAGSSDMVANNPTLVANAIDWLLEDESLIGIRDRAGRPALEVPAEEDAPILVALMVGGPWMFLLGLFGWLRWRR
jgi:ABC-2 type transport system permease protein